MATARGRGLRISYGSAVASGTVGSSSTLLKGVHRLRVTPDSFEIAFSALLVSPTKSAFDADHATFEASLDTPRQDVLVEVLDPPTQAVLHTLLSFSHTGNTGLNIRSEWTKGGRSDTIVSRLYEVTVNGGRPATYLSQAGLREFEYDVSFSPSRRGTLIVRGVYTAVGGTQAAAQYKAQIAARVATITSALTGAWALALERYTPDDTDQVVRFTRTYKELLHNESAGLLDHPGVSDQQLAINRVKGSADSQPGSGAEALVTISADFSAAIDKEVTKGLGEIDSLWLNTLRPWILSNVESVVAAQGYAVVSDRCTLDPVDNVLRANLTVQAAVRQLLAKLVTTDDEVDYGKIVRKTWPEDAKDDLQPTPAYTFRGPKTIKRTISTTTRTLGQGKAMLDGAGGGGGGGGQIPMGIGSPRIELGLGGIFDSAFGIGVISSPGESFVEFGGGAGVFGLGGGAGAGAGAGAGGTPRWEALGKRQTTTQKRVGRPGESFDATDRVTVETFELLGATPAQGGGGGGEDPRAARTRTR